MQAVVPETLFSGNVPTVISREKSTPISKMIFISKITVYSNYIAKVISTLNNEQT